VVELHADRPSRTPPITTLGFALALLVILGPFVFAYWPAFVELQHAWSHQPDYSHGYLVVPMALFILWLRRERFPGFTGRLHWVGLGLLALSVVVRVAGAVMFLAPIDGWSIVLWTVGAVWFLFGPQVVSWAFPSILFLFFMVPLPFRMETWLSVPLQKTATVLSCWTLQLLGQPALSEGNTIFIGEHQMFVEEACSGLRIFVAIFALAYVYLILVKQTWWQRLLLVAAILPVALVANVTRIVVTSLLYQFVSTEAGRHFSHDWAGFLMIPFAAALFGLILWYISALFREVEQLDVRAAVRRTPE